MTALACMVVAGLCAALAYAGGGFALAVAGAWAWRRAQRRAARRGRRA